MGSTSSVASMKDSFPASGSSFRSFRLADRSARATLSLLPRDSYASGDWQPGFRSSARLPEDLVERRELEATVGEIERQIEEMVHRETRAWDEQDVSALLDLFHPDMVWAWPPDPEAHDPVEWVFVLGRYDRDRWGGIWGELFASYELVRNRREIRRIQVTEEGDGALAVVDIDTRWRHRSSGTEERWTGRTCKVYTKLASGWKIVSHFGVLEY